MHNQEEQIFLSSNFSVIILKSSFFILIGSKLRIQISKSGRIIIALFSVIWNFLIITINKKSFRKFFKANSSVLTLLRTEGRFSFLLFQEASLKTKSSIKPCFKHFNKSSAIVVKGQLDR